MAKETLARVQDELEVEREISRDRMAIIIQERKRNRILHDELRRGGNGPGDPGRGGKRGAHDAAKHEEAPDAYLRPGDVNEMLEELSETHAPRQATHLPIMISPSMKRQGVPLWPPSSPPPPKEVVVDIATVLNERGKLPAVKAADLMAAPPAAAPPKKKKGLTASFSLPAEAMSNADGTAPREEPPAPMSLLQGLEKGDHIQLKKGAKVKIKPPTGASEVEIARSGNLVAPGGPWRPPPVGEAISAAAARRHDGVRQARTPVGQAGADPLLDNWKRQAAGKTPAYY